MNLLTIRNNQLKQIPLHASVIVHWDEIKNFIQSFTHTSWQYKTKHQQEESKACTTEKAEKLNLITTRENTTTKSRVVCINNRIEKWKCEARVRSIHRRWAESYRCECKKTFECFHIERAKSVNRKSFRWKNRSRTVKEEN